MGLLEEFSYPAAVFSNFGPLNQKLEQRLNAECRFQPRKILTVSNCTDGLSVGLMALGVQGKVVVPSFTFAATAQAVLRAGCQPIFCDSDAQTWGLSVAHLAEILQREKVGAVMPVRIFGFDQDLSAVCRLAEEHGVPVIIDSAGAFGGPCPDFQWIGQQGTLEVFSFHATKVFNVSEGGMIVTPEAHIGALRSSCNFGFEGKDVVRPGLNAKMSEFHAAIALAALDRCAGWIARRREVAETYHQAFSSRTGVAQCWPSQSAPWQTYPLLLHPSLSARKFVEYSAEKGLELRRYYSPALHATRYLGQFATEPLPVADDLAGRIVCLPVYSELGDADLAEVVSIVEIALRHASNHV